MTPPPAFPAKALPKRAVAPSVSAPTEKERTCSIRYFSPKMEIPLCGHATLAAAKVRFSTQRFDEVHFLTIQHLLLSAKAAQEQIVMEFPVYDTHPADAPPALLAALGVNTVRNVVYKEAFQQ